jgi:hypothetical protein
VTEEPRKTLSDGTQIYPEHTKINPVTGQQQGYVVLAETYARDPHFYSGTFCFICRAHFPVGEDGEFHWIDQFGNQQEKVGT